MGLFNEQLKQVKALIEEWSGEGRLRTLEPGASPWPRGYSLVLQEDTGLELGNPSGASLSILAWGEPSEVCDGRVSLVGPDVAEAGGGSIPFGQVVLVGGEFDNEYDSFRDIRDAVYDTHLDGFSVRTLPSRQTVWCRVSTEAREGGFSLADLGAALIEELKTVEPVSCAEVLFVTSERDDVERLAEPARGAQRVIEAMMKMYQEANFDCETCEYKEVCDSVMDLKKIRDRLAGTIPPSPLREGRGGGE
ncbi:MAG: hypothetical protein KKF41_01280 [Actinobacteria bacterium]|nr:hypothetical protein [Actinomycetota bacterium]MBU1943659.1 hypothetical protein [Actinomycetota bacterium]MBU2686197.1 hypothetical protein [Actinomycetota bacterium]